MELRLKYGCGEQSALLPPFMAVKELRSGGIAPLSSLSQLLAGSLEKPVGIHPFDSVFRRAKNLLIVMPADFYPHILSEITAQVVARLQHIGVPPAEIRILLADSSYSRQASRDSIADLAQQTGLAPERIYTHCTGDTAQRDYFGDSRQGFPVYGNRLLLEADELLLIGVVQPHLLWGMTGGPELLFPGCMHEETLLRACDLLCRESKATDGRSSVTGANPAGKELLKALPATFSINLVVDETGRVVAVVSGKALQAYLAAAAWMDQIRNSDSSPPGSLTIASCGGCPFDDQLDGLGLALNNTLALTHPGGDIVLLARCGMNGSTSSTTGEKYPARTLRVRLEQYLLNRIRGDIREAAEKNVFLVSELPDATVRSLQATPCRSLEQAIGLLCRGFNPNDAARVIGNACMIRIPE